MGEIADAMIAGDMCHVCGEWLGNGNGNGYEQMCAGCEEYERRRAPTPQARPAGRVNHSGITGEARIPIMLQMVADGLTHRQIAAHFGIGRMRVKKLLSAARRKARQGATP